MAFGGVLYSVNTTFGPVALGTLSTPPDVPSVFVKIGPLSDFALGPNGALVHPNQVDMAGDTFSPEAAAHVIEAQHGTLLGSLLPAGTLKAAFQTVVVKKPEPTAGLVDALLSGPSLPWVKKLDAATIAQAEHAVLTDAAQVAYAPEGTTAERVWTVGDSYSRGDVVRYGTQYWSLRCDWVVASKGTSPETALDIWALRLGPNACMTGCWCGSPVRPIAVRNDPDRTRSLLLVLKCAAKGHWYETPIVPEDALLGGGFDSARIVCYRSAE